MPQIRPVVSEGGWRAFREVPASVYAGDLSWFFDPSSEHAELLRSFQQPHDQGLSGQAFVAFEGDVPVGRIVALQDPKFQAHQKAPTAFFGFYEARPAQEIANRLLDAAASWARDRSLSRLVGPMNPTLIHGAGLVLEPGEQPPLVGMPHNPPYYAEQLTRWGMQKEKDLHSFQSVDTYAKTTALRAGNERWLARSSLRIRSLDMSRFSAEVEHARRIYNASFKDFWGYRPLDATEFLGLAESFKPLLDPELVLFATLHEVPVGFLMAIPDVNQALFKAARWKAGLMQNVSAWWNWKGPGRRATIRRVRVDMLAVDPGCPLVGAPLMLIHEMITRVTAKGYDTIEAAPLLEDVSWWPAFRSQVFSKPCRVHRIFGRDV